jgi:hypothetical protein
VARRVRLHLGRAPDGRASDKPAGCSALILATGLHSKPKLWRPERSVEKLHQLGRRALHAIHTNSDATGCSGPKLNVRSSATARRGGSDRTVFCWLKPDAEHGR